MCRSDSCDYLDRNAKGSRVTNLTEAVIVDALGIHFIDSVGARIDIASDMSFSVAERGSLCLVGRSGSGKTSILRAVAGLAAPNSGSISWWGRNVGAMSEDERRDIRRKRIGYVDQAATLVSDLSALENILLPVVPDGRRAVKEHEQHAMDLLRAFGLDGRAGSRPSTLSGGEKQRVSIARALLNHPALLIVDEPTASLDAGWADQIIGALAEYQREGAAVVIASHDPAVISACDSLVRVEPDRGIPVASPRGAHIL